MAPDVVDQFADLRHRERRIHGKRHFRVQSTPEPSGANRFHTFNAAFMFSGVAQLAHNAWLYAIQHSPQYGVGGLPDDSEDRNCNDEADDWVGERKPHPYSERAEDDRQAC